MFSSVIIEAFLATIRWQDLVDITINSYILFRMYVLFRGTNALRILLGIAALWSLQRIAGSLGLIITSWALQGYRGSRDHYRGGVSQ